MKTKPTEFTARQIRNWKEFEEVRSSGRYNMFDPNARLLSGLTKEEYAFSMDNYSDLKKCSEEHQS